MLIHAAAAEQYALERRKQNLWRIRIAMAVGTLAHLVHVIILLATAAAESTPAAVQWRSTVIALHFGMAAFDVALLIAAQLAVSRASLARVVPIAFTLGYSLFGAAITGNDQLITPDVSPWTLLALGSVLVVEHELRTLVVLLIIGTLAYLGGQAAYQADSAVLVSNSVKGLSSSVVAGLVAMFFARHRFNEFTQRRVIEQQRAELEEALKEARDAAARADAANAAKSTFLATISHEIRTPMTGVLGVADLLGQTKLDDAQRELLTTVQESGSTLVALISDLLDLSKAEAGRLRVEAAPFDLKHELEAVVRLFNPRAKEKGLVVRLVAPAEPVPPVLGDGLRLRQVLSNLVGNGLKFTTLGSIELRCLARVAEGRAQVQIDVVDTGPGITAEVLARLFQPWAQADEHSTRTYGGTGLGLVISRQLAEAMGGRLEATSVVGKGSTFSLHLDLPLAPASAVLPYGRPARAPEPAKKPLSGRVLVVDDNAVNQLVAQGILRQLGLEVEVAGDGAGAQVLLSERPFDVVVSDLHMPRVDGVELLKWVRAQSGLLQSLPVVMLTADLVPEEHARCLAAGANAVLSKPFRAADLEATLRAQVPHLSQVA